MSIVRSLTDVAPRLLIASTALLVSSVSAEARQRSAHAVSPTSALEQLGLTSGRFADVTIRTDGDQVLIDVDLGDGPTTLSLAPFSVRAPAFAVTLNGDPSSRAAEPPLSTYRGTDTLTGGRVAASIVDGRVSAVVLQDGREPRFIQPLSEAGAAASEHVVYSTSDLVATDHHCGANDHDHDLTPAISMRGEPVPAPACLRTAEIIFDTDNPFVTAHASPAATTTDIEGILNQVDLIYQRDVQTAFQIKQINLRTDAATDPYRDLAAASVDPNLLLNRVNSVWSGVSSPTRDLVHLMTGRDLSSSVIGIAWIGVVCRSSSHTGLSQSLYTTNLARRAILTAHEIGHNFGAPHDASGSFIMAPATGPSSLSQFSAASITTITGFIAANGTCLASASASAVADSAQAQAPAALLIDVLANDVVGCGTLTLSVASSTSARGGAVSIIATSGPSGRDQIRYVPPANVSAAGITDTFTYRIQDSGSGSSSSAAVTVTVAPAGSGSCAADFNRSGSLSVQDLFDFLAAYFRGDSTADFNSAGGVSIQDFFDYLSAYFRGC